MKFVEYIRFNFENKELIEELTKYIDMDVIFLILWWRDNVKSTDTFIVDMVERYNLTLNKEQYNKIFKYLEVLNI